MFAGEELDSLILPLPLVADVVPYEAAFQFCECSGYSMVGTRHIVSTRTLPPLGNLLLHFPDVGRGLRTR
jgi:hypothetical protein